MQRAKEELEKRKRKVNSTANKGLKQDHCDQNAPVVKCQVSYFNLLLSLTNFENLESIDHNYTYVIGNDLPSGHLGHNLASE